MPAIVYNTRFDPAYHNAEDEIAQLFALPLNYANKPIEKPVFIEPKPVEKRFILNSSLEKYFFMGVIIIGLAILLNKAKI